MIFKKIHLIHFIDFLELLSSDCAVQAPISSIFFLNLDSCKSERHKFWYQEPSQLRKDWGCDIMGNLKYFIQLGIPPCLLFHPDHPVSHRDHQGDPDFVSLKLPIALLARLKKMLRSGVQTDRSSPFYTKWVFLQDSFQQTSCKADKKDSSLELV